MEADDDVHLLWVGIVVEGGLIAVALFLAWWGLYDHGQPLDQLLGKNPAQAPLPQLEIAGWGLLATLPLLIVLAGFHFLRPPFVQLSFDRFTFLRPMQDFVQSELHPLFRSSTLFEMFLLSMLAGVGEELLFRWCLQGGITSLFAPSIGVPTAAAIGMLVASILFGLCHWVNNSYGITTLIVGFYFGGLMLLTGSVLVPMITHALYDFVAMIYIGRVLGQAEEVQ
jgi:membrane protease YdiL (CAAX protease family)